MAQYLTTAKKAAILAKYHGSLPTTSMSMLVDEIASAIANNQGAAVADLNQTISAAYADTEVQAISDKVDALLASLRAANLLAS